MRTIVLLVAPFLLAAAPPSPDPDEKIELGVVFVKNATPARETPDATSKGRGVLPAGMRLVHTKVKVGVAGEVLWYFAMPPGPAWGWIPASEVALQRAEAPPPLALLKPVHVEKAKTTVAQPAVRGGPRPRHESPELTEGQILAVREAIDRHFSDPATPQDGSYADVTVEGRRTRAEAFKAGLE